MHAARAHELKSCDMTRPELGDNSQSRLVVVDNDGVKRCFRVLLSCLSIFRA